MTTPIGWYVRVTTVKTFGGGHDTMLYIAGFPTPVEAETAVRRCRMVPGEQYEVLGEIVRDLGPQPAPGEVRLLGGRA